MNASQSLSGTGYLIVHVTTASGAIPLVGALVNVYEYNANTEGGGRLIASLVSARDGNTDLLSLPTLPRSESLVSGNPKPYATYRAEVHLEGFSNQSFIGIPIFDGIVAVQPVHLIPLPEVNGGTPEASENDQFFETPDSIL